MESVSFILMAGLGIGARIEEERRDGFVKKTKERWNKFYDLYSI